MKNKILKITTTIVIAIIIISNLRVSKLFIQGLGQPYDFHTENMEFQFRVIKTKGRDVEMMNRNFSDFKKENPHSSDSTLFRAFEIKPLKFWNWYDYLTEDVYRYPYKK